MIFISHRGNLDGPNPEMENNPDYILEAIQSGFQVEIDTWVKDNSIYLGHDEPKYLIDLKFIGPRSTSLWLHCKNLDAITYFLDFGYNCFFHDKDNYTITTDKYIWAYPGQPTNYKTILVLPEQINNSLHPIRFEEYAGICSDNIRGIENKYRRLQKETKVNFIKEIFKCD